MASAIASIGRRVFYALQSYGKRALGFLKNLPFRKKPVVKRLNPSWFEYDTDWFSFSSLFFGLTILTSNSVGNFVLQGNLPFDEYNNASFTCYFEPFEKSNISESIQISNGGKLMINGSHVEDGSCSMRKVESKFLFMSLWDGVIKLGNGKKTIVNFEENKIGIPVRTEFTPIIAENQKAELDVTGFLNFDKDLGSTTNFQIKPIEDDGNKKKLNVKFEIEKIGEKFDLILKANETFPEDYPLVGVYTMEDNKATYLFNWRRDGVPFYIVSNGVIEFKKPKHGLSSIIFSTDGKEMRFQGSTVEDNQQQISNKSQFIQLPNLFIMVTMLLVVLLSAT